MISYILIISILALDLFLGLLAYFKNSKNKNNRAFLWVSFWTAVWIASNFLENEPIIKNYASFLLKLDFASAAILAYSFFFFCINFPRNLKIFLWQRIILISPALAFFILSFSSLIIKNFSFSDSTIQFDRGVLYWVYALFIIVYVFLGSLSLVFRFRKLKGLEKIQTFYIILGFTLSGVVAISINLILTQILIISTEIYRLGIYGILFFIIFTTYALIKHHLMNIKVILTEILVGLVGLVFLIDLLLSESFYLIILKICILVVFVYLGVSLIRSVLREIEMAERVKRAYDVEKHAHQERKRLDAAKNQFIMASQHHLRTPLTSMRGYLDLLLGGTYGKISPKVREILKRFNLSSERLIKIINEFLDISQFQLGKEVIMPKPGVDMGPILKEIEEELCMETDARGLYLKIEKEKNLPKIKADPGKLKIALYNIVDNGIKYTREGGISVSAKSVDSKVRIAVKDTGVGISKEQQKGMFTRLFERGKEASKLHGTGRGIGLYIAYHIIKAHKGRIWVESKGKGAGSVFYIELPVG